MIHTRLAERDPLQTLHVTFLDTLVQTHPFSMTVKDAHTGRYFLANEAAAKCYGLTPDAYCGLTFEEIGKQWMLPAKHVEQVIQKDAQVCTTKQSLQYQQIIFMHNQTFCIEQVVKQPILDHMLAVKSILTYSQDLTFRFDLCYLFSLYKQYLSNQQSVIKFLQYLQLEIYFQKFPTKRELETLLALRKFNTTHQASQYMGINSRTVEEYKARLRDKLKIELRELLLKLRIHHEDQSLSLLTCPSPETNRGE